MNIIEAAKALDQGKEIRRKDYAPGLYLKKAQNRGQIYMRDKADPHYSTVVSGLDVNAILSDDWEVVEELSPMERAWKHQAAGLCFPNAEIRTTAEYYFEKGWKKAQEHFTVYGDKQL